VAKGGSPKHGAMSFRAAAFLVVLASLVAPARADVAAANWKLDNPFCNVIAEMAPLAQGTGYGLALYAAKGTSLEAHLTLISNTDAYDAHVGALRLSGPAQDRAGEPVLVKVPSGVKIEYYFVDSYAFDGGQAVTCPSYVSAIGEGSSDLPQGAPKVNAQHLQSLGTIACGKAYQPPSLRGDVGAVIGHYGNKPLSVKLRAYVDSNGHAIGVKTIESSGVEGVDRFAVGSVRQQEFNPARFLCTPVVSEMLLRMEYQP
jgi:hypothetical protein